MRIDQSDRHSIEEGVVQRLPWARGGGLRATTSTCSLVSDGPSDTTAAAPPPDSSDRANRTRRPNRQPGRLFSFGIRRGRLRQHIGPARGSIHSLGIRGSIGVQWMRKGCPPSTPKTWGFRPISLFLPPGSPTDWTRTPPTPSISLTDRRRPPPCTAHTDPPNRPPAGAKPGVVHDRYEPQLCPEWGLRPPAHLGCVCVAWPLFVCVCMYVYAAARQAADDAEWPAGRPLFSH